MRTCEIHSTPHGGLLTGVFWGLVMTGAAALSLFLAFTIVRNF
ncbi:MAG: hypothetical protein R3F56_07120 [Planctomycetota bacterium]